ncbi:MAG: hypothetical protein JXR52_08595, partial [Bacteroidales bacterium]|nr:hypothetical protein [Bacteroidales bacterium]
MKRNLLILFSLCFTFFMLNVNAQVHPDGNRLINLWDFEFGNADDAKGFGDGELKNGAMVSGGQLQLTALDAKAGFVDIPGDAIEINTLSELTLEVWAQPIPTANSGANMLM